VRGPGTNPPEPGDVGQQPFPGKARGFGRNAGCEKSAGDEAIVVDANIQPLLYGILLRAPGEGDICRFAATRLTVNALDRFGVSRPRDGRGAMAAGIGKSETEDQNNGEGCGDTNTHIQSAKAS